MFTIFAPSFDVLYFATFFYALSNGTVEAVINPVVATIYKDNKTHWLNMLHAGWPGGLVLGGLLAIAVSMAGRTWATSLPGRLWQWQMAVLVAADHCLRLSAVGSRFPAQERVAAGVSFREMLEEFGWGSAYIVSFLMIMGISQVLTVLEYPTPIEVKEDALHWRSFRRSFLAFIRSFGRPMFVFLMLVMFLLATTELGTDGWIQDIMGTVLKTPTKGTLFFVYTAAIMFVLRFFAGPIVHRISPLGLLACSAALAAVGLYWLGNAGRASGSCFWPPRSMAAQDVLLADDAGRGFRAVSEGRGTAPQCDQRRRHDRRRYDRRPGDRHAARHGFQSCRPEPTADVHRPGGGQETRVFY